MRRTDHGILVAGLALLLTLGACGRPGPADVGPTGSRSVQQAATVTWSDLVPGVYYHYWQAGETEFAYIFRPASSSLFGFNTGRRIREAAVPGAPQLNIGYDFQWTIVSPTLLNVAIFGSNPIQVQLDTYNAQADIALVTMSEYGNALW